MISLVGTSIRHALLAAAALLVGGCTVYAAARTFPIGVPRVPATQPNNSFAATMLDLHNGERARLGVPPLAWDPLLAEAAAAYAAQLATGGALRHSYKASRPGQGENLWMGTRGVFPPAFMVGSWLSERSLFRPGIFPNVSSDGDWSHVGHYTALIWRDTTRVGCAIRSSARDDYLVCRYTPSGNIMGRPVP